MRRQNILTRGLTCSVYLRCWYCNTASQLFRGLSVAVGGCPPLQGIWGSFERGFNPAQETAVSSVIVQVALFEVNWKEQGAKLKKPFDSQMDPDMSRKYKEVWINIVLFSPDIRLGRQDADRPEYELLDA